VGGGFGTWMGWDLDTYCLVAIKEREEEIVTNIMSINMIQETVATFSLKGID